MHPRKLYTMNSPAIQTQLCSTCVTVLHLLGNKPVFKLESFQYIYTQFHMTFPVFSLFTAIHRVNHPFLSNPFHPITLYIVQIQSSALNTKATFLQCWSSLDILHFLIYGSTSFDAPSFTSPSHWDLVQLQMDNRLT